MTLTEYFESLDPRIVAEYPDHIRGAHDYLALAYQVNNFDDLPRVQLLVKQYLSQIEKYLKKTAQQRNKEANRFLNNRTDHSSGSDGLNAPTRIEKRRSVLLDDRFLDDISPDIIAIKKYISFHQRKVSREEVRTLLNYIRRARLRGEISENAQFYEEVKSIQEKLVAVYRKMSNTVVFELENYDMLFMLTHPIKLKLSVLLLKRYIGLGGKRAKDAKKRAKDLLQEMEKVLQGNKITPDDPFYSEVKDARDTLKLFLRSSRQTLPIVEAELYGLDELSNDLNEPEELRGLDLCNEGAY